MLGWVNKKLQKSMTFHRPFGKSRGQLADHTGGGGRIRVHGLSRVFTGMS